MGLFRRLLKDRKQGIGQGNEVPSGGRPETTLRRSSNSAVPEKAFPIENEPIKVSSIDKSIQVLESLSRSSSCIKLPHIFIPLIVSVTDSAVGNQNQTRQSSTQAIPTSHEGTDSLYSRMETLVGIPTAAEPRLQRSLQRLNASIEGFEQIYAKHQRKGKYRDGLSDSLSKVLNEISPTDDMFHSAAALESRINETMIKREELQEERKRRQSLSRYVVSVFPLVKFLVDLGGMAVQV